MRCDSLSRTDSRAYLRNLGYDANIYFLDRKKNFKEAMKREYANYQKVSLGLKGGSFVRRAEFLPVAGEEMPDMSALVMQRGVADVKAFMPKVGGKLEGELLLDEIV